MNTLWEDAKKDFLLLDNNLKIKWLALFSEFLTIQFRIIFHEENDVQKKLDRLYSVNEVFHQINPQIARKSQSINTYPDEEFIEYLYSSISKLDIDVTNFFKKIKTIEAWSE